MAEVKLQYGIRNGQVIHVNDLTKFESGIGCNCTCPRCGEILIAKLANQRRAKHFAHHPDAPPCDIQVAQQTALHRMAKVIIAREKKVVLPPVTFNLTDTQEYKQLSPTLKYLCEKDAKEQVFEYKGATRVGFDSVKLEKRLSNIIPDLICSRQGTECLIEITVTHPVDEQKVSAARELGLSMVEMNLSDKFSKELPNEEKLTDFLVNQTTNRVWKFNTLWRKEPDEIKNLAQQKCAEYARYYGQVYGHGTLDGADADEPTSEDYLQVKKPVQTSVRDAFEPYIYETLLKYVRNDQKFKKIYKTLRMYSTCPTPPFFVDIPIRGEFVFGCDRRIWQSLLFDTFVFRWQRGNTRGFDIRNQQIEQWARTQEYFPLRRSYLAPYYPTEDSKFSRYLLTDVIEQYLRYLDGLGFIEFRAEGRDGWGDVLAPHTVTPPNTKYAWRLKDAIDHADSYDPNVDDHIAQYMNQED